MSAPEIVDGPPLERGAEVVPGYTVTDHLRRGEDYDTYTAWSAARYSHCVVKTPRPDRARQAAVRRTLVREGRLLLAASHPHLVRAYELHAPRAGAPALVLEALGGPSLAHLLTEHARLPAPTLAYLGHHLCSAARYLHDRGHLHLDIKPSNIIVSGGAARLIDLGLSRPPGPCRAGVGTAPKMAPEQALGEPVSAATDTWGIGLVLYEAATGHRPFGDGGDMWSCRCGEADCSWSEPRYLQLERRAPKVRARRRAAGGGGGRDRRLPGPRPGQASHARRAGRRVGRPAPVERRPGFAAWWLYCTPTAVWPPWRQTGRPPAAARSAAKRISRRRVKPSCS